MRDAVDGFLDQWADQRPELDVSPMAVIGRLHRLGAILDAELRRVFAEAGLGPGDFDVLAALRRSGTPLTPSGLGESLMITGGAVTKRVDRLIAAGLVRRTVATTDGRGRVVSLSAKGRQVVDNLAEEHFANEDRLLSALSSRQRDQLAGLLRRLLVAHEGPAAAERQ